MCAAMKSTAEASSGCSSQTFQISPVVTGTFTSRFTRWIYSMSSSVLISSRSRFVADDDRANIAVVPGKFDDVFDFLLVAILEFIDPRARRDLEAEFVRDPRYELKAAGRSIGADRMRVGRNDFQVGANLRFARKRALVGLVDGIERRERELQNALPAAGAEPVCRMMSQIPACKAAISATTKAALRMV